MDCTKVKTQYKHICKKHFSFHTASANPTSSVGCLVEFKRKLHCNEWLLLQQNVQMKRILLKGGEIVKKSVFQKTTILSTGDIWTISMYIFVTFYMPVPCAFLQITMTSEQTSKMKEREAKEAAKQDDAMLYGVEDNPPWYLCIILGFQVFHFSHCILFYQKDFAIVFCQ